MSGKTLLEVSGLKTVFHTSGGTVRAADDVSFHIGTGETLALVGESGSGKSVTALSILRLIQSPGKIISGEIRLNGADLLKLGNREMRSIRGNEISMIFQEPMTSLNPLYTVGNQIMEAVRLHQKLGKSDALAKTVEMLRLVGIADAESRAGSYPHEMSGGMRQRVMIAMALACKPKLLIADEPTTALDVTIQAQIMELLRELREKLGMAMLLITHDFGIVAEMADRVGIMYAGKIVEYGSLDDIFNRPGHPYTVGLLNSIPGMEKRGEKLNTIPGNVPDLLKLPPGCSFQERCPLATSQCREAEPNAIDVGGGHLSRCWHRDEVVKEGLYRQA